MRERGRDRNLFESGRARVCSGRARACRRTPEGEDGRTRPDPGTELQRLLDLVRDADSVELKLTLPENARAGTGAALGVDPLEAQLRQVFFFDTPDLALNAAGVVVRARRRQGEEADTVVKLRPVVPAELPKELRRSKMFNVEVDAMPGGFVCSASLKGTADNTEIREVPAVSDPSASSSRKPSGASMPPMHPTDSSSTSSPSWGRSRSSS